MRRLLASPRRRRKLAWSAAGVAALAGVGVLVAALPGPPSRAPDRIRPGAMPVEEREVRLTSAMRRSIDATLERFVPAAVGRRNPELAWQLAGPMLRMGTTRRDWLRGTSPVYAFPYRGKDFSGWVPQYTYPNRVGFDLILHPRPDTKLGGLAVAVEVVRRPRGSWRVNYWQTTAMFSPPREKQQYVMGTPDYQAGGMTRKSLYEKPQSQAKLSVAWVLVPLGALAAGLLAPVALVVVSRLRGRRAAARA